MKTMVTRNAGLGSWPVLVALCLLALAASFVWSDGSCLSGLGGSAVGSRSRYSAEVRLRYEGTRSFTFERDLSRERYDELKMDGDRAARELVDEARRALATKLGYGAPVYGQGSGNLVVSQVEAVKVKDDVRGTTDTVVTASRVTSER